jgi:hypothetical protein
MASEIPDLRSKVRNLVLFLKKCELYFRVILGLSLHVIHRYRLPAFEAS